jgi:DNA-binding NarL/FixJ family response regulator
MADCLLPRVGREIETHLSQTKEQVAMLIVEDQELMRRMLREYLQSAYADAAILEASDGARALELCRTRFPQLVVMDVGLPDANGIDLTVQIKEMLPQTAVIVVSQHSAEAYVVRAQAAGAFAYISKDKIYREVLPAVRRALGGAPSGDAEGTCNE